VLFSQQVCQTGDGVPPRWIFSATLVTSGEPLTSNQISVSLIRHPMKILSALLFLSIVLLPAAALAQRPAAEYPATYAGGSLPLDHHKVRATFGTDEVVFTQGDQRIAVPVKSITEISCGTEVRHRLGGSVLDVVPLMHLGESAEHYIGVAWSGAGGNAGRAEVLLKLSRGQYREFLAALEQATGIKAVDTNQVPTVVRYQS
jgi:hypothetical protein